MTPKWGICTPFAGHEPRPVKEDQQNAEGQRERYYATIHKVALSTNSDKIPGESSRDRHCL